MLNDLHKIVFAKISCPQNPLQSENMMSIKITLNAARTRLNAKLMAEWPGNGRDSMAIETIQS